MWLGREVGERIEGKEGVRKRIACRYAQRLNLARDWGTQAAPNLTQG